MATVPVYNLAKEKIGSLDLDDQVFSGEVKAHLIHDVVRGQIANRYAWKTANSYTRSEVRGTRKKMFKQKGTGQARHGDAKAPIFVGGGKAHGPKPRLVLHKINKKVRQAALKGALSLHHKEDRLYVFDRFALEKPSTKQLSAFVQKCGVKKGLVINTSGSPEESFFNTSLRNLKDFKFIKPEGVNVFDLIKYQNVLISRSAVEKLTERLKNV